MKTPDAADFSSAQAGADATRITIAGRSALVYRRLVRGERQAVYTLVGRPLGTGRAWSASTGLSRKADAVAKAKILWQAKLNEHIAPVREALEGMRLRKVRTVCPVGELIGRYERAFREGRLHCQERAMKSAVSAMRRMIAWRFGWHSVPEGGQRERIDSERVDRCSATVIEAEEFIGEFERLYIAAAGADLLEQDARRRGVHSVVTNARAMFRPAIRHIYKGLELPALEHFMTVQPRVAERVRHEILSDAVVMAMAQAARPLRETNPALYLVHLLHRQLGMRNSEIEAARVEWIERLAVPLSIEIAGGEPETVTLSDGSTMRVVRADKLKREAVAVMAIVRRSYWTPKRGSGRVAIGACVWEELRQWVEGRDSADPLVPAVSPNARHELIYYRHADFMRPYTEEHQKRAYELRRWGATKLVQLHRNEQVADYFLRHGKRSTAGRYYLETPMAAPLLLSDCGV